MHSGQERAELPIGEPGRVVLGKAKRTPRPHEMHVHERVVTQPGNDVVVVDSAADNDRIPLGERMAESDLAIELSLQFRSFTVVEPAPGRLPRDFFDAHVNANTESSSVGGKRSPSPRHREH
jgi:hypothetical protein